MKERYVVVTPTRDEERTVERTLRSMASQTIRPVRWVIVNDGSTDRTREIVSAYAEEHDWIVLVDREDRGHRALGGGVVHAFNRGLDELEGCDWDYIVKLDADLEFAPDYFANLLARFDANPKLAMASGKTFIERGGKRVIEYCHDEHVRGPAKMYTHDCFERIGGLEPVRGWDMIDETRAQMAGFETRSFIEEEILHLRPIDARQSNVYRSRFEMGALYHFLGYHWLYHAVRSLRSAVQDFPIVIGGALLLAGYAWAAIRRTPRYDAEYTAFVHRKQLARFNLGQLRHFIAATAGRSGSPDS